MLKSCYWERTVEDKSAYLAFIIEKLLYTHKTGVMRDFYHMIYQMRKKSKRYMHTYRIAVTTMSETVQLKGSPIQRRQERIEAFKALVASNRKRKSICELIALYALESGFEEKS